MFCIYDVGYDKNYVPFFSNNNYVAKQLVLENSVFPSLGRGNWNSCASNVMEGLEWAAQPWEPYFQDSHDKKSSKVFPQDPVIANGASIYCGSSSSLQEASDSIDLVITDPPFGDNFIYSEMANFFYAWLRIPLSRWYEQFKEIKDSPNVPGGRQECGASLGGWRRVLPDNDDGLLVRGFPCTQARGSHGLHISSQRTNPMGNCTRSVDGFWFLYRGDLSSNKR